jgi:hypothetical protein
VPTTLQLHASSYVCIGMWSYALCLYLYPVYLPVCCLVVNEVETSAYKIQTPGNYPEENIQHTEHGESLKSGILSFLSAR